MKRIERRQEVKATPPFQIIERRLSYWFDRFLGWVFAPHITKHIQYLPVCCKYALVTDPG